MTVFKEKVQFEVGQLLRRCLNFGQNLRLKAKQPSCLKNVYADRDYQLMLGVLDILKKIIFKIVLSVYIFSAIVTFYKNCGY